MAPVVWPTYESYVDSGVEWLGCVPTSWELKRLGSLFNERRSKVSDQEFQALSVTRNGVVPQLESAAKTNDGDNRKLVRQGDFVINSRSDRKGSSGVSPLDGSVSLINIVLEPTGILPQFCNHLLKSYAFVEEYYRVGRGIVADLWTTRYDEMRGITMALPSVEVQRAIADFLDEKCAKVDEAVRIKEEQIALLRERRQILIQQAVTRGLNPDAPMKDSGIEWIRKIPSNWTVKKLKNLCRFSGGSTPSKERVDYWEDGTVPWVSPKDMKQSYIAETQDRMTEKAVRESTVSFVHPGSLLIVVRSGILQRTIPVAINSVPVTLNQDMKALTFGTALLAKYMMFLIEGNSGALLPILTKEGATVESIEQSNLANCHVPAPPSSEQKAIVAHLEKSNQKLDGAIKIKEKQIAALKEYKTTLINAAVTGKIKVA